MNNKVMKQAERRTEYLRKYQSEYFVNNEDQREKRRVRARKNYRKRNPIEDSNKFKSLGWYCKCSGVRKKDLLKFTNRTYLQQWFNNKEFCKIDKLIQEIVCTGKV
jgi:hypothetical protein